MQVPVRVLAKGGSVTAGMNGQAASAVTQIPCYPGCPLCATGAAHITVGPKSGDPIEHPSILPRLASDAGAMCAVSLMRAAALLWLDARDKILCALSAEDGEWVESLADAKEQLESMGRFMDLMHHHAGNAVDESDGLWLIFEVLTEQATLRKYTIEVNWSLYL